MRLFLYFCVATFSFIVLNVGLISGKQIERWSINAATNSGHNLKEKFNRVKRNTGNIQEVFDFGPNQRQVSVDSHNNARKAVNPPAADMTEMSWDDELGALALSYSQECVFEHNPSRRHSRFNSVGENIYLSTGRQFSDSYINNAIVSWDDEKVDYDFETNSCVPGKICGHYTQVVWASSFKVGCGATLCNTVNVNGRIWRDATILVCNYGPAGNFVGRKPYIPGIPCSQCLDPSDTCNSGLCFNQNRLSGVAAEASWLEWGSWGECSESCGGNGRRYRSRDCSTFILDDCDGFSRQFDPFCANRQCTTVTTTEPAFWQQWGSWTQCSQTCGHMGTRFRSRTCSTGLNTDCSGSSSSIDSNCANQDCPNENSAGINCSDQTFEAYCSTECHGEERLNDFICNFYQQFLGLYDQYFINRN